MKKVLFLFITFLFSINFVSANNYIEKTLDGHKIKIIEYDLRDPSYIFKIGVNLDYNATSLKDLMISFNGVSAVNGVFLCPADYSECGGKNFTKNERYYKGYKIGNEKTTGERVVFGINRNKKPFLYQTDKINPTWEKYIYYGFANFPLFLESGESKISDYKLDYKMKVKAKRNFICSNKYSDFIKTGYIYNISLAEMPDFLKKLDCYNALNLDAGATSSMIYNGKQIIGPGRKLLDGIVIEKKGVNTKKILEKVNKIIEIFTKNMQKKDFKFRYDYTKDILGKLKKIRTNTYTKNSIDLFDKKGQKIGYEIRMNNKSDINFIFIINTLEEKIIELNKKYKEDFEKEENAKKLLF